VVPTRPSFPPLQSNLPSRQMCVRFTSNPFLLVPPPLKVFYFKGCQIPFLPRDVPPPRQLAQLLALSFCKDETPDGRALWVTPATISPSVLCPSRGHSPKQPPSPPIHDRPSFLLRRELPNPLFPLGTSVLLFESVFPRGQVR